MLSDSLHNRIERYESRYDRPLRDTLRQILHDDQEIRQKYVAQQTAHAPAATLDSLAIRMEQIDTMNERKVTGLFDHYGWLGTERVGDLASVQFLVIQHAPLEMQLKYRPLLQQGLQRGDITAAQYALFEDRVALRQGKKQRYGTQIETDSTGAFHVSPCIDPAKVNQWRSEIGLPPMNEYLRQWGLTWNY